MLFGAGFPGDFASIGCTWATMHGYPEIFSRSDRDLELRVWWGIRGHSFALLDIGFGWAFASAPLLQFQASIHMCTYVFVVGAQHRAQGCFGDPRP